MMGISLIALAVAAGLLAIAYLAGSNLLSNRQAAVEQPSAGGGSVILGGDWGVVNDFKRVGDELWAATDAGLIRWFPDGQTITYNSSEIEYPGDCVNTLDTADESSDVWMGCGGVTLVRPSGDQIEYLDYFNRSDGLGMGVVRDLLVVEDGTVWAGGNADPDGMPLSYYDGENWSTENPAITSLSEYRDSWPSIRTIYLDASGRLWLGSDDIANGGILLWDGESYQQFTYQDPEIRDDRRVLSLLTDSQGNVWVAAEYWGLLNLVLDSGQFVPIQLPDYTGPVDVVTELADGSLWVGGEGYIAMSSDFGKTWSQVGTAEGLGEEIISIVQTADGQIFAGSHGGGISIFEDGSWKPVPVRQ